MASNELYISVITATWNAERCLPRLISSLQNQTDGDFKWVVADGGSTDGTLTLLNGAHGLNLHVSSQADFGIYDALNRAIESVPSGYYLVVGADDWLAPDAIENFRRIAVAAREPDLVAAAVRVGHTIVRPRSGLGWLYGMAGVSSSHAVGTLIKRSLHERFGMYSRRLPLTADQLFIKTVLNNEGSIVRCEFVAGEFSLQGTSGQDGWGILTEIFRVQVETERWVFPQLVLFILRCIKRYATGLLSRRGAR